MLQEIEVNLNVDQLSEKLTSPLALEPGMLTGFSAYIGKYLGEHFTPPDFEKIVKLTATRSEQIKNLLATSKNDPSENQTAEAAKTILTEALDSKKELPDLSIQKISLLFATFQNAFNAKAPGEIALLQKFAATVNSDQFIRGNRLIAPNFMNDMTQLFDNLYRSIGINLGGNTNSDNQALNTAFGMFKQYGDLLNQPKLRTEFQIRPATSSIQTASTDIKNAPW